MPADTISQQAVNSRLERIERKLDDLNEAFIILARTEEKLTTAERDRTEIQNRITTIDEKIAEINSKVDSSLGTTSIINKIFWITLSAAIGIYVVEFINKIN